jgi:hypothetical protein
MPISHDSVTTRDRAGILVHACVVVCVTVRVPQSLGQLKHIPGPVTVTVDVVVHLESWQGIASVSVDTFAGAVQVDVTKDELQTFSIGQYTGGFC